VKAPLLFLSHRIPYPPNKGDKIRSYNLLKYLAQHFDIHLGTFIDDEDDLQWIPEMEKLCTTCHCVQINPLRARLLSLTGLLTGDALSVAFYRNSAMTQWVRTTCDKFDIDQVLVYSSAMARFTSGTPMARKVIDYVDVDSDKWRQYASTKPWPLSAIYRREASKLLGFEREVISDFDAGLFVSAAEADVFRQLAPEAAAKIGFYNNGVDSGYFQPSLDIANPYSAGEQAIVFTGAMDYWPNIDAVQWYADEVLPQLREQHPELVFYIVGSNPSRAVQQLASREGVVVTGRVPDVRPYLQHAIAAVAPMRIARGVQNKVLEGMAMAKPVVVSDMGLEGIACKHGEGVLIANNVQENVDIMGALVREDSGRHGEFARDFVSQHFTWAANLPKVASLFNQRETGLAN
jgi:sugar transferase (PEP-CTERM/EpsH1 system associated)